ncbi:MAG: hypothetical protein J7L43_00165, partial [Candidatus Aenigmarchaeota archaeon]|nr:hypothetical protein [Candidatus Aenigmarchaeota archaeon]
MIKEILALIKGQKKVILCSDDMDIPALLQVIQQENISVCSNYIKNNKDFEALIEYLKTTETQLNVVRGLSKKQFALIWALFSDLADFFVIKGFIPFNE